MKSKFCPEEELKVVDDILDDITIDTYYFMVPSRIVWDHWKEYFDEDSDILDEMSVE